MTTEKILVGINDEIIELTGADKEAFLAERQVSHEASLAFKNAQLEKQQARQSALAKLAALGLTEEEIAAL
jgi:DNA-binding NarL/FixJ family response regulator